MDGGDFAMQRRIRVIPWLVIVDDPDPRLETKLAAESSGILNWLIAGYRAYRLQGLGLPTKVQSASQEYFSETDPVRQFLEECCQLEPTYHVAQKTIYAVFQRWCEETGHTVLGLRWFKAAMQQHGVEQVRRADGRVWQGVTVNAYGLDMLPGALSTNRQESF
jgi:putative DNA primase/helicase